MVLVEKELQNAYIWEYVPPVPPCLCFTANTDGSTVQLTRTWSPTEVTLETSLDGDTRTTYTIGSTITLSNIWDKVYFRNSSETDTGFCIGRTDDYYNFVMSGSIAASGDVTYLLNKNWTTTLSDSCFSSLFNGCTALTTAPKLQATTIENYCCYKMFYWCTNLETLVNLAATTLAISCYVEMFRWCSKIKVSSTQTWEYQTGYRIPTEWTWTSAPSALVNMFYSTWWTFTWEPTINTTYYTSNTIV